MAKFNVVQKQRRAAIAERKRAIHGDPLTKKLNHKKQQQQQQQLSISGKRKRKLFKKWRRDQKESALRSVIAMQDVQMMAADHDFNHNDNKKNAGTSEDANKQPPPRKFHVKKSSRLKVRQSKKKDKNRRKSDQRADGDAMEE